jgi:adenylate cyclase
MGGGGLAMTSHIGSWKIPLDDQGRMMIHYYGPADTLPVYPLAKVLQSSQQLEEGKTPDLNPEIVKDKIVLIGVAAPGLYDLKPMPLSRVYPGPEIHATVIQNLLNHEAIAPVPPPVRIFLIIIIALLATFGLALIHNPIGIGLLVGGVGVLYAGTSIALFSKNIWIPVVSPVLSFGLASFGMMVRNYLVEGRKKREIRKAFGQYLSPDVVSEIAKNPDSVKMGGGEAVLTIFFSDIANFTSISEKMTPPKLVADLNHYLTHVTRIILEHEGTLDKYIGDAVMAFWGAPLFMTDHEKKAVLSAIAIQQKLEEFPNYVTRIGIHTGPVVVGNIGSEQRFNYTAIGDTVNLASRLEGLNKKFGTRIIVSETTYYRVRDEIAAREIGRVRVKGRVGSIGIYQPLGSAGEVDAKLLRACEKFGDGLAMFREGKFPQARARFEEVISIGEDRVAEYYKILCDEYIKTPPQEFDGVITFETK